MHKDANVQATGKFFEDVKFTVMEWGRRERRWVRSCAGDLDQEYVIRGDRIPARSSSGVTDYLVPSFLNPETVLQA